MTSLRALRMAPSQACSPFQADYGTLSPPEPRVDTEVTGQGLGTGLRSPSRAEARAPSDLAGMRSSDSAPTGPSEPRQAAGIAGFAGLHVQTRPAHRDLVSQWGCRKFPLMETPQNSCSRSHRPQPPQQRGHASPSAHFSPLTVFQLRRADPVLSQRKGQLLKGKRPLGHHHGGISWATISTQSHCGTPLP